MFRLADMQLVRGQVAALSGKWFTDELENCRLWSYRAVPLENSLNMACGQSEAGIETGFITKTLTPAARGTWTPGNGICPLLTHTGPSSQYIHILCCFQQESINRSGWGVVRALNCVSMDRQSSLWALN